MIQHGWGEFADLVVDDAPVFVDEKRLGQGRHAIKIGNPAIRVQTRREGVAMLFYVLLCRLFPVQMRGVNHDDLDLILFGLVNLLQQRHLPFAVFAPSRPKINDRGFTGVRGKPDRLLKNAGQLKSRRLGLFGKRMGRNIFFGGHVLRVLGFGGGTPERPDRINGQDGQDEQKGDLKQRLFLVHPRVSSFRQFIPIVAVGTEKGKENEDGKFL